LNYISNIGIRAIVSCSCVFFFFLSYANTDSCFWNICICDVFFFCVNSNTTEHLHERALYRRVTAPPCSSSARLRSGRSAHAQPQQAVAASACTQAAAAQTPQQCCRTAAMPQEAVLQGQARQPFTAACRPMAEAPAHSSAADRSAAPARTGRGARQQGCAARRTQRRLVCRRTHQTRGAGPDARGRSGRSAQPLARSGRGAQLLARSLRAAIQAAARRLARERLSRSGRCARPDQAAAQRLLLPRQAAAQLLARPAEARPQRPPLWVTTAAPLSWRQGRHGAWRCELPYAG
jgi:hypothetical protein